MIDRVQQEAGVEVILAFKGFAMWSVFSLLREYIGGATASSLHEAILCNEKMSTPSHTYCVAYRPSEFNAISELSSHVTFNSLSQYAQFIDQVPGAVSVGLRVNPEYSDVATDLYNPASPTSRLGIRSDQLQVLPERVEGLHFHVLCESSAAALEKVLKSFESRFGHLLPHIRWVNMGGGHLMTRKGYDVDRLIAVLKRFKEKHDVDVVLEPGSAFAWETGDLHTQILDVVHNGGVSTAIFDGSFTCHMPDCLEMPYRPQVVGGSPDKVASWHRYHLGGMSCLAGDFLEDYWFEQPLQEGDVLTFKDMMHYTMVKTTTFNGVKHPSIAFQKMDGSVSLLKEFGYSDYMNRLS